MKSTIRYHLKNNLRVSIGQRVSFNDRMSRANAIRIARDYARFRDTIKIELKD